jgi:two-component system, sensor histidine kinase LadS
MNIWKRVESIKPSVLITCTGIPPAIVWGIRALSTSDQHHYIIEAVCLWAIVTAALFIGHKYYDHILSSLKLSMVRQEFEIKWKNLMLDNTDEVFIVLNMYGQIVTYNQSFETLMGLSRTELQGKPLRAVFMNEVDEENSNLSYVLLDRFRDVFMGREAHFTYSFRFKGTDRVVSLNLDMQPVFSNEELQNILVSGHTVVSDEIAMKYLVREQGFYCMDNNVAQLYQLSYRLTRNLERWLPRTQIYLLQMALQEVLINAVEHGNLEMDYHKKTELQRRKGNYWDILIKESDCEHLEKRRIHVSYTLNDDRVVYVVKDEGNGFEWKKYLEPERGHVDDEFIRTHHGIGLQLVRNVFDLSFDSGGSEVTMVKRFDS